MKLGASRRTSALLPLFAALALASAAAPREAAAQDLSVIVARAREQTENGAYAEALRTLAALPKSNVPPALAVEAGLLETTAALVVKGADAGQAACSKAVIAAGYDPEVAREQSPKVRAACKAAAAEERRQRLARANVKLSDLDVQKPEVAWQPIRISATSSQLPPWLRVMARVTSSALEGSFDLALAPSLEGPLRGTLDPSWMRPKARIKVELVAQDKFGDLASPPQASEVEVPAAEARVALGEVPSGAVVSVDGTEVKPEPTGTVAVSPGSHTIKMELEDGASASTKVDVPRGSVARVALSPQTSGGRALAWIATGTSVALGAAGGVMLFSAASRASEIEELSQKREAGTDLPATEYSEIASKNEDRQTFATVGTVLLIGAGVTAAAAITLWVWPAGKASDAKASAAARPLVTARIGPTSIGIAGSF
ncbi:MAG TPA: hypothetical protein VE093_32005 [Polyangiaceae bacterium]|jgi:hypothetical protein|nr:hypothetical protein [Polyangiaceae bacterium]